MEKNKTQHEEFEKELLESFHLFDEHNYGYISVDEMKDILKCFHFQCTDEQLCTMLLNHNINESESESGNIKLNEFMKIFIDNFMGEYQITMVKQMFEEFDVTSSGGITKDNIQDVMGKLGEHFSTEEANDMVKLADLNNNGIIEYKEFTRLMNDLKDV